MASKHGHGGNDPHYKDFHAVSTYLRMEYELKTSKMMPFLDEVGIKEGWHILDVGCGFCPLLERYKQLVGRTGSVTLVDPEPKFRDSLIDRLGDSDRFLLGTAESDSPEFRCQGDKAGYDLVVLGNVYHHLPDVEKAMASIRSKMKTGGRLVIFDFVHNSCQFYSSRNCKIRSLLSPDPNSATARCSATLPNCGFAINRIDSYSLQGKPGSKLWRYFSEFMVPNGLNVLVKRGRIQPDERLRIIDEELAAMSEDSDAVLFGNVAIQVEAEKTANQSA